MDSSLGFIFPESFLQHSDLGLTDILVFTSVVSNCLKYSEPAFDIILVFASVLLNCFEVPKLVIVDMPAEKYPEVLLRTFLNRCLFVGAFLNRI